MKKLKKPFIFTLIMLPIAVVGSFFTIRMSLPSLEKGVLDEAVAQVGSRELLVLLSMIQPVAIILLCSFFGYILSEKIGLMRSFRLEGKKLLITLVISVPSAALFSLDPWTFGKWIPQVEQSYSGAGSFDLDIWLASILYGGIGEEVMMRLFFMSLIGFLAWKIFFRKRDAIPTGVFTAANIIAAALFAALHLPATALIFGELTPLILLRCFLLNGAFGLIFGWLYRHFGIQYAMLSHILFHIVSRTIWIIAL